MSKVTQILIKNLMKMTKSHLNYRYTMKKKDYLMMTLKSKIQVLLNQKPALQVVGKSDLIAQDHHQIREQRTQNMNKMKIHLPKASLIMQFLNFLAVKALV